MQNAPRPGVFADQRPPKQHFCHEGHKRPATAHSVIRVIGPCRVLQFFEGVAGKLSLRLERRTPFELERFLGRTEDRRIPGIKICNNHVSFRSALRRNL